MEQESVLKEFAQMTTIHGVQGWIIAERHRKSYPLFILFILAVGGFIYQAVLLITGPNPTIVHLSVEEVDFYEYPNIRFCPRNWVDENLKESVNISEDAFLFALSMLDDVNVLGNLTRPIEDAEQDLRRYMAKIGTDNFLDVYKRFAYKPKRLFKCTRCEFGYPKMVVTSEGVCYNFQFKSLPVDANDKYAKAGLIYTPDMWNNKYKELFEGQYREDTVYVAEEEMDFFGYDPIRLPLNSSILIQLYISQRIHLSTPKSPCLNQLEWSERKYGSVKMCFANCRAWYETWRCRNSVALGYFEPRNGKSPANLFTSFNDSRDFWEDAQIQACLKKYRREAEPCFKKCKLPCEEQVHDTEVKVLDRRSNIVLKSEDTETTTGADVVYEMRTRKDAMDDNPKSLTKVALVHNSSPRGIVVLKEMQTETMDTLLSNLGGSMGLWAGVSVLSLCQALYYFMKWLSIRFIVRERCLEFDLTNVNFDNNL